MSSQSPLIGGDLTFLQPFKTESEIFSLPSGEQISIPKYFLRFDSWKGAPIPNTYNGKAVIDWNGERMIFMELKRSKKDAIQKSQLLWLGASFNAGFDQNNFALIEWDIS